LAFVAANDVLTEIENSGNYKTEYSVHPQLHLVKSSVINPTTGIVR
jgi:hypothetical protein